MTSNSCRIYKSLSICRSASILPKVRVEKPVLQKNFLQYYYATSGGWIQSSIIKLRTLSANVACTYNLFQEIKVSDWKQKCKKISTYDSNFLSFFLFFRNYDSIPALLIRRFLPCFLSILLRRQLGLLCNCILWCCFGTSYLVWFRHWFGQPLQPLRAPWEPLTLSCSLILPPGPITRSLPCLRLRLWLELSLLSSHHSGSSLQSKSFRIEQPFFDTKCFQNWIQRYQENENLWGRK